MKKGAKEDARNKAGQTPLLIAVEKGAAAGPLLSVLATRNAVDVAGANGQTPVHLAAAAAKWDVLDALLKAGAKLSAQVGQDDRGLPRPQGSCLSLIKEANPVNLCSQELMHVCACVFSIVQDGSGRTALMHLVTDKKYGEARVLLDKGDCGLDVQVRQLPW